MFCTIPQQKNIVTDSHENLAIFFIFMFDFVNLTENCYRSHDFQLLTYKAINE